MRRHHFDAFSGQPPHPTAARAVAVASAMSWADPTAGYHEGAAARNLLEASRMTVAAVVGVEPNRVSFRRSGADAATAAVDALVGATPDTSVWASAVERRVILSALQSACSGPLDRIPVDSSGVADITALWPTMAGRPLRLVLQVANAELGSLQPIEQVIAQRDSQEIALLSDATGALGIIPIPPGWSVLVADAAGWAGPREAAIVIAPPDRPAPSDTLGLPEIIATAAALDSVWREASTIVPRLQELTASIRDFVGHSIAGALVFGPETPRLPNIVSFSIPDVDASMVQTELDRLGVAVASGSACADRSGRPSHVLQAAGLITVGNIRVSLPWDCDEAAVSHLLDALPIAVQRARASTGIPSLDGDTVPRDGAGVVRAATSRAGSAPGTQSGSEAVSNRISADRITIDAVGLRCPAPIIKLSQVARQAEPGSIIELRTDDPAAPPDVQAWCRLSGSELLSQQEMIDTADGWIHLLRLNTGSSSSAGPSNVK